jgi:hypothetical protein
LLVIVVTGFTAYARAPSDEEMVMFVHEMPMHASAGLMHF